MSNVRVEISLPPSAELLKTLWDVPLARRGEGWSERCLGPEGKKQGVYVIHHGEKVIYVGKTDGQSMTFGVRLRREFQESASGRRHIFPTLSRLTIPPSLRVCLLPTDVLRGMVKVHGAKLSDVDLIRICECVLIATYRPELQVGVRPAAS